MLLVTPEHLFPNRRRILSELRRLVTQTHGGSTKAGVLSFGLPALDAHLPRGGLSLGALHEIAPDTQADVPAAFGFMTALLGRTMQLGRSRRPIVIVTGPDGIAKCGHPHGHGFNRLGLDPARLLLISTADEKQSLWAMEEALRSALPAAVAGITSRLAFKTSQRLHLAAENAGCPLLLLRPNGIHEPSIAMTRWRVAAAVAARDRFGLISNWRWKVQLARCRNGRPGEWLVEFDHAYRFSLAAAMADPALSHRPSARSLRRAG